MEFITQLPWPKLTNYQSDKIIQEFDQNKQFSKKVTRATGSNLTRSDYVANSKGYYNLSDWPTKLDFLANIFLENSVTKDNLDRISIQSSIGDLDPHTDFARTVTALCIIEGPADTVFYQHKNADVTLSRLFNKSELTEMHRQRFELNTWYLFNNSAIHGVDNYQGRRIGLTMDLTSIFGDYTTALKEIPNSDILFI
jgi:hypothetical protein